MQTTPELTIKKILWESYERKIRKGIETIKGDRSYSFEIKPLTQQDLLDFIPFYNHIISQKNNAKPVNLEKQYFHQINNNSWLYFASLKKDHQFLAGAISRNKELKGKNCMTGCVQVGTFDKINNVSCLYYMEYLFFQLWFELWVECFSDGKDRNCYGFGGPSIGLAVHKLQKWYIPYPSIDPTEFVLDTNLIQNDILLFDTAQDPYLPCTSASLWTTNKESHSDLLTLLEKRKIKTDIYTP